MLEPACERLNHIVPIFSHYNFCFSLTFIYFPCSDVFPFFNAYVCIISNVARLVIILGMNFTM